MRARKSLNLLRARDLQSNSLVDIQNFMDLILRELDKQYRLLYQDVATIQVDDDGFIYFGEKDTDGTWRIGRSGTAWNMERRESGAYVAKGASTA